MSFIVIREQLNDLMTAKLDDASTVTERSFPLVAYRLLSALSLCYRCLTLLNYLPVAVHDLHHHEGFFFVEAVVILR